MKICAMMQKKKKNYNYTNMLYCMSVNKEENHYVGCREAVIPLDPTIIL